MEFSYTESTDTSTNMVTKDYSKSRMRENCKYGSVRGGQSNLIPSTRLRGLWWRLAPQYIEGRFAAMSFIVSVTGCGTVTSGGQTADSRQPTADSRQRPSANRISAP